MYTYRKLRNGNVEITGLIPSFKLQVIKIPSQINGYSVKKIANITLKNKWVIWSSSKIKFGKFINEKPSKIKGNSFFINEGASVSKQWLHSPIETLSTSNNFYFESKKPNAKLKMFLNSHPELTNKFHFAISQDQFQKLAEKDFEERKLASESKILGVIDKDISRSKLLIWVLFFPLMLTYWAWKNENKSVMYVGVSLCSLLLLFGLVSGIESNPKEVEISIPISTESSELGQDLILSEEVDNVFEPDSVGNDSNETPVSDDEIKDETEQEDQITETDTTNPIAETVVFFEGYEFIEVEGGDLSGIREVNAVVNIGFGDREYYAFTNEFGQLVKIIADVIVLQNEETEPVLSTGRYYPDEAKVPGTESPDLDEGHVIADSLGGVANAYNITPQDSTLNRYGDQAYMESVIRSAGGCTDFVAIITYPNNETQIPSHYSFTYTINDYVIHDEFDNVNPDSVEVVEPPEEEEAAEEDSTDSGEIIILYLDKVAEYITIKNTSNTDVNIQGWKIFSVTGEQDFFFPSYVLKSGDTVKVGDSAKNSDVDFHWLEGRGCWNNSKSDPAELYDNQGQLIDRYNDY